MSLLGAAVTVAHLTLLASWMGAMGYSLVAVQPKVAAYFADDDDAHEMFLVRLAHGNRWRVVTLVTTIFASGAAWVALDTTAWPVQALRGVLLALAAGLFWYVSWRHWPARVFALPEERVRYRARLRATAMAMAGLVGTVFVLGAGIAAYY